MFLSWSFLRIEFLGEKSEIQPEVQPEIQPEIQLEIQNIKFSNNWIRVFFLTDERRYEQMCKARKENSFFNIQPDLKTWLGNKETPKFFLSVLAHDIVLQIIDNYLRQVDLAETTFF